MGALEPAALLRSPRPDFTDPADLERYLSTVRKEDLQAVLASLSAQADQAEAACWEQINWGLAKLAEVWTARSRGPMTGTRLPDQNNEQRSYLVARVLPTPRWTTTSARPWTTPAGPSASACAKTRRTDGPHRRREDHQGNR